MIRVIIIGLGLEGLVTAWVFRQHPLLDVWNVGRVSDMPDRLPVLAHTESTVGLLNELRLNYASYAPRDGILIGGEVERYPHALRTHHDCATEIFHAWQAKAGIEPAPLNGELKRTASKRRLRCDIGDLVRVLCTDAKVIACDDAWRLEPGTMHSQDTKLDYDFAVITVPLWEARSRVWFRIPTASTAVRTVATVRARRGGKLRRWDRVLTPYTPGDSVYEVYDYGDCYETSIAGKGDAGSLLSDLNFLFPEGYGLSHIRQEPGRLARLDAQIRWPENIAPLGEFAEWRDGRGLEEVLDTAYDLMRRWLR